MKLRALLPLLPLLAIACEREPSPSPSARASASASSASPAALTTEAKAPLQFAVEGEVVRTLTKQELVAATHATDTRGYDPYYERVKAFRCLPLREVLRAGFGKGRNLGEAYFVLRAEDGYTVPLSGARLLEQGACLAVADLDAPGWEPIGQQKAHPGPYYLTWRDPQQADLERYPRPWQLATIEITTFERQFPHTVPAGTAPDSAAHRGFTLFKELCIRCHAVNQEGGQVGPELNIPQNILAYRPEEQVRSYIRDPTTYRYSKMPSFPHLTEDDLDALIAYLRAMGERQHDPKKAEKKETP